MNIDQKYMLRCIQLGKKGLGATAPNPMVGCVLVVDDNIIGEGFTSPYGGPHAEVNALHSVKDQSLLNKATLYVTLEPCSHYGKTPPCADAIIKNHIKRVVIGIQDPNTKVAGAGIQKLKASGIEVTVGVLENECRQYLCRFFTYQVKKRPYIILKWAQTQDGFIAPTRGLRDTNPQPYWISNEYSKQLVHKWRSEEQAILVGTNTALADDPSLTTRLWMGKNPIRIVLDRSLKIKKNAKLFDDTSKTIVFTAIHDASKYLKGVQYVPIDFENNLAKQLCDFLYRQDITSVLIEGGTATIQTFIDCALWDEARIFKGNLHFGQGTKAPLLKGMVKDHKKIEKDELVILQNVKNTHF